MKLKRSRFETEAQENSEMAYYKCQNKYGQLKKSIHLKSVTGSNSFQGQIKTWKEKVT